MIAEPVTPRLLACQGYRRPLRIRYVLMNGSRSPSSTRSTSPTSSFVAVILDEPVRVQDVASDLTPERDPLFLTTDLIELILLLFQLGVVESRS